MTKLIWNFFSRNIALKSLTKCHISKALRGLNCCMRHLIQSNSNSNNQDLISNHASRLDWESLVEAIALRTQQSLALSTILQTTADAVQQILQCDRIFFYQFSEDQNNQDEFLAEFQETVNLVIPLFNASQHWGVLIAHNDTACEWNAEEIHRLQQIAIHVGIAINQSYLREQLQAAKESISAQDGIYASELKSIDISDRKKVELENRETQNFLNSIIENVPNMLFVKDAENLQFVRFNNAGEELLGYSRESLIGKSDYDFFPPEEANFFITKDREVLANSKVLDIPEEVIQTKNKGKRILHTKKIPIFDESGRPQYLLGISEDITEDITERRQAELALQESESRFQKIALSSPGGIYILVRCLDESAYFEYVSSAFEDICEISINQLLGNFNTYKELIHPDDLAGYQKAITYSINNLSPFKHSWRITTPTQKLKWVQVTSRSECRDNGDIAWYGVMLDIGTCKK